VLRDVHGLLQLRTLTSSHVDHELFMLSAYVTNGISLVMNLIRLGLRGVFLEFGSTILRIFFSSEICEHLHG